MIRVKMVEQGRGYWVLGFPSVEAKIEEKEN